MIRSFADMDRMASDKGPKRLVVLAPEDEEFMMAVRESAEKGYTRPVLIGDREKMERLADQVHYDISSTEKIYEKSRQAIADLGISMLFSGEVDIAGKGQIPTAYIYRAIIREESKAGKGKVVSVISMWDIEGLEHLTCFTDTGVNITPRLPRQGGDRAQCRLPLPPARLPEAEDLCAVRKEGYQRRHPLLPGFPPAAKGGRLGRTRCLRGEWGPRPSSMSFPRGKRPLSWRTPTSAERSFPTSCWSPISPRATSSSSSTLP